MTPLSATSEFICVGNGKNSHIGKFTKKGYRLVSTGSARDTILAQKSDLQSRMTPVRNIRAEVNKDKKLKKGELTALNKTLKIIDPSERLQGSKEEKLALLDSVLTTIKRIILLKKSELQTLSDCVHNKVDPDLLNGLSKPQVYVVRYPGGEGIAVLAILVMDKRLYPTAGGFCVKEGSSPAFETVFSTNPCPDILHVKSCKTLLGANKIGKSTGGGAIFDAPPGEVGIQGLVGQTIADEGNKTYEIKPIGQKDAGKTCGQIFGE